MSGNHNDLYELEQAAREREARARDDQLMARIQASQKQVEEALNAPKTLPEQIAEAAAAGEATGEARGVVAVRPMPARASFTVCLCTGMRSSTHHRLASKQASKQTNKQTNE